jgi:hypothetical protein
VGKVSLLSLLWACFEFFSFQRTTFLLGVFWLWKWWGTNFYSGILSVQAKQIPMWCCSWVNKLFAVRRTVKLPYLDLQVLLSGIRWYFRPPHHWYWTEKRVI